MANLLVGDTNCPYDIVAEILSEGFRDSDEHPVVRWNEIAIYLELQSDQILQICNQIKRGDLLYATAYNEILELWRQQKGNNATLSKLITVLDELNFRDSADNLRHNFGVEDHVDTNLSKKTKSRRHKYIKLPKDLEEFLKGTGSLMVMCTLDSDITIEKIELNLKTRWSHFSGDECLKSEYKAPLTVLTCVSSVADFLPKFHKICCHNKVLLITTQMTEEVENMLKLHLDISIKVTFDNIMLNDLSEKFQKEIKRRKIRIQSKEISAEAFFVKQSVAELETILQGHFLIALINDTAPEVINVIPLEKIEYYIPRKIISRNIFSTDILNVAFGYPDVFACSGIKTRVFSQLVKNNIDNSTNQLVNIRLSVKHIILDNMDDFEKICDKTDSPVHWLHYKNGAFRWIKSRGSISVLRKEYESSDPLDSEVMTEEDFILHLDSKNPTDTSLQPVCFSDLPGMGKSVLLVNLGRTLSQMDSEKVILFFSLSDIANTIKKYEYKYFTTKIILEILTSQAFKIYGEFILREWLQTKGKLELMFDGLDEVIPRNIEEICLFLKCVVNFFPYARVWVATRPQYIERLEENFQVLGHNIKPFSTQDQLNFLTSFWSLKYDSLNKSTLQYYAENCLKALKEKVKYSHGFFVGIPLQCLLIALIFNDDAVKYSKPGNQIKTGSLIRINISSVADLYIQLHKQKVEVYHRKYDIEFSSTEIEDFHIFYSIKILFPEWFLKFNMKPPRDLNVVINVGILESTGNSNQLPKFIHRTFAEFYVSRFIAKVLSHNKRLNQDILNFLCTCILSTTEEIVYPLNIDDYLRNSIKFEFPVICYFINSIFASLEPATQLSYSQINGKRIRDIFYACIYEDYINIFRMFVTIVTHDLALQYCSKTLLDIAVNHASQEFFHEVLTFCLSASSEKIVCVEKYIHFLIENIFKTGDFPKFEFIIKQGGERLVKPIEQPLFSHWIRLLVKNSKMNSNVVIEDKVKIINWLLDKYPELNQELDERGNLIINSIYIHSKLFVLLAKAGAEKLIKTDERCTLLHLIVNPDCSSTDYDNFVQTIEESELRQILKTKNMYMQCPLLFMLKHIEPLKSTLAVFQKCAADFNAVDCDGRTVLMTGILHHRSRKTLELLIQHGANYKYVTPCKNTMLHIAAMTRNAEAVDLLLKQGVHVLAENDENKTAFSYCLANEKLFKSLIMSSKDKMPQDRFQKLFRDCLSKGHPENISMLLKVCPSIYKGDEQDWNIIQTVLKEREGKDRIGVLKCLIRHSKKTLNCQNIFFKMWYTIALKTTANMTTQTCDSVVCKMDLESATDFMIDLLMTDDVELSSNIHSSLLDYCLQCGADLNAKHFLFRSNGGNSLNFSIRQGSFLSVKYFLDKGLDVNAIDDQHNTIFHNVMSGIELNAFEILKLLLTRAGQNIDEIQNLCVQKANLNVKNNNGDTPLHLLLKNVNFKYSVLHYVKLLVSHGSGINELDRNNETPLRIAVKHHNLEVVKFFMDKAESTISRHEAERILFLAAKNTDLELIAYLCDWFTTVSGNQITEIRNRIGSPFPSLFHAVVAAENLKVTEYLLNAYNFAGDVEQKDLLHFCVNQPLERYMLAENRVKMIFLLSRKFPNIFNDQNENSFISLVSKIRNESVFSYFVQFLPFVPITDKNGNCFLHRIIEFVEKNKFCKIIKICVDAGLERFLSFRDKDGRSILHHVVSKFEVGEETLGIFKAHAVNFNAIDNDGSTIITAAVKNLRSKKFLKSLVKFGANPFLKNNKNETTLHWATRIGYLESVQYFVSLMSHDNLKDLRQKAIFPGDFVCPETVLDAFLSNDMKFSTLHYIKYFIRTCKANLLAVSQVPQSSLVHLSPKQFHKFVKYLDKKNKFWFFQFYDEYDRTLLHYAVHFPGIQNKTLRILCQLTNINAVDKYGISVFLQEILAFRNKQFLTTLIEFGADYKGKTKNNCTALNISAKSGNLEALQLLVSLGCEVNVTDKDGNTPLHQALMQEIPNQLELVNFLIREKANIDAKNKENLNPLDYAVKNGKDSKGFVSHELIQLIKKNCNANLTFDPGFQTQFSARSKLFWDLNDSEESEGSKDF